MFPGDRDVLSPEWDHTNHALTSSHKGAVVRCAPVALWLGRGRVRQGGGGRASQRPPLNQWLRLQTPLDFNRTGSTV